MTMKMFAEYLWQPTMCLLSDCMTMIMFAEYLWQPQGTLHAHPWYSRLQGNNKDQYLQTLGTVKNT